MGYLVWQDVITFIGTIFGAAQSSRVPPGYPSNLFIARFINGLNIAVIVAISSILSNASYSVEANVNWVMNVLNFPIPLYGYALVITLGVYLPTISVLRLIFIRMYTKMIFLVILSVVMMSIDIFVLIHMMSLC